MIEELIARLEAATGPDRELDAAIAGTDAATAQWHSEDETPFYTASIDAALTLVPVGWSYEARQGPSGQPHIWDLLTIKTGDVRYTRVTGRAKSAAAAASIAALRAMQNNPALPAKSV